MPEVRDAYRAHLYRALHTAAYTRYWLYDMESGRRPLPYGAMPAYYVGWREGTYHNAGPCLVPAVSGAHDDVP